MGFLKLFLNDKIKTGIILGTILSVAIIVGVVEYGFLSLNMQNISLHMLFTINLRLFNIMAIGLILFNTILLTAFNYWQHYYTAKGVFFATLFWGLLIFLYKLYLVKYQF